MSDKVQNYGNHRRLWPLYHFVLQPILLVNFVFAARTAMTEKTWIAHWLVVVAFALLLLAVTSRLAALTVQSRLIRLEMRLRLQQLLVPTLFARVGELSTRQLVALRFASDAELPRLVERTVSGEFPKADAIKRAITDWQADWSRV